MSINRGMDSPGDTVDKILPADAGPWFDPWFDPWFGCHKCQLPHRPEQGHMESLQPFVLPKHFSIIKLPEGWGWVWLPQTLHSLDRNSPLECKGIP